MITYKKLKSQPKRCLALTGLTPVEFEDLLPAFAKAHADIYPSVLTVAGQPRQRWVPAGRPGALSCIEDKLLFVLVYQKTYPLQVVLGELFGIGTSQVNYWLQRLLPVLRAALDHLGVLPERNGKHLATMPCPSSELKKLIIDGTERRRQRPKSPAKQALFYSGKKKAHTDKNIIIVNARNERVLFLSTTYAGKTHDKKIADQEQIVYPREAILYKDAGFQGYEPLVKETCQAKKKATRARAYRRREAHQP
jgi:transposase